MSERWAKLDWLPGGYIVSDQGRVRRSCVGACILVGHIDRYGYRTVGIARRTHKVHRLVCLAFHGAPPSDRHEVGHLDSEKLNNAASNLAWVTRSENQQHNIARGVRRGGVSGERHHSAKLSYALAAEIRMKAAAGMSVRSLAREYGVSHQPIHDVITGKTWRPKADANPLISGVSNHG